MGKKAYTLNVNEDNIYVSKLFTKIEDLQFIELTNQGSHAVTWLLNNFHDWKVFVKYVERYEVFPIENRNTIFEPSDQQKGMTTQAFQETIADDQSWIPDVTHF